MEADRWKVGNWDEARESATFLTASQAFSTSDFLANTEGETTAHSVVLGRGLLGGWIETTLSALGGWRETTDARWLEGDDD